ncbi:hypothetical protein [Burkholderia sp. AU28863]|uniref:hypothetical protein n=1 Tax=Burkholderia sp. AU28863 TaxID=2015352 RepID=UPI0015C5EEC4|nr:hypothetical protein [Burkholderia sp. AU28863]
MIEWHAAAGVARETACKESGMSPRHIERGRYFIAWYLSDQLTVSCFSQQANSGKDDSDKTV